MEYFLSQITGGLLFNLFLLIVSVANVWLCALQLRDKKIIESGISIKYKRGLWVIKSTHKPKILLNCHPDALEKIHLCEV